MVYVKMVNSQTSLIWTGRGGPVGYVLDSRVTDSSPVHRSCPCTPQPTQQGQKEKFQGCARARGEKRRRGSSFLFARSSLALY